MQIGFVRNKFWEEGDSEHKAFAKNINEPRFIAALKKCGTQIGEPVLEFLSLCYFFLLSLFIKAVHGTSVLFWQSKGLFCTKTHNNPKVDKYRDVIISLFSTVY